LEKTPKRTGAGHDDADDDYTSWKEKFTACCGVSAIAGAVCVLCDAILAAVTVENKYRLEYLVGCALALVGTMAVVEFVWGFMFKIRNGVRVWDREFARSLQQAGYAALLSYMNNDEITRITTNDRGYYLYQSSQQAPSQQAPSQQATSQQAPSRQDYKAALFAAAEDRCDDVLSVKFNKGKVERNDPLERSLKEIPLPESAYELCFCAGEYGQVTSSKNGLGKNCLRQLIRNEYGKLKGALYKFPGC
jgi:hypothetical protein